MPSWFRRRSPKPEHPAAPPADREGPDSGRPDPSAVLPEGFDGGSTLYVTTDAQKDTDRIRMLVESLRELSTAGEHGELLVRIVDRAIRTVGAQRGLLFLSGRDEDGKPVLRVARDEGGRDLPRQAAWSSKVVEQVLGERRAVCLKIDEGGDFDPTRSMLDLSIRAVMCVPLQSGDKRLGAIYVDTRASAREFSRADLRFFEAFADMLAVVWMNREAEEERLYAARAREALELARTIQGNLVPERPPLVDGYSMCGRMLPADETGGDYFDFFRTRENLLAMAVGDVSGHGIGAALVMSAARAYLRSFSQHESSPAAVLRRVNRHLAQDVADDMFTSMFFCVLDPVTRRFSYANAGHRGPLLLRASTGEVEEFDVTGMALAVADEADYEEKGPFELASGDTVVLFSDGLKELRRGDEQYGSERIEASLRAHAAKDAPQLLDGMFSDALAFPGKGGQRDDDITIALLRAH